MNNDKLKTWLFPKDKKKQEAYELRLMFFMFILEFLILMLKAFDSAYDILIGLGAMLVIPFASAFIYSLISRRVNDD